MQPGIYLDKDIRRYACKILQTAVVSMGGPVAISDAKMYTKWA